MNTLRKVLPYLSVLLLVFGMLACSLPGIFGRDTATPVSTSNVLPTLLPPRPTPQPLPPTLVESDPLPGVELPLNSPISLYFNQPMEPTSVEAALTIEPTIAGQITWQDEATLVFSPSQPLSPESLISLTIKPDARARNGLSLPQPIQLDFQTVGYLHLTQSLPESGTLEVNPASAVVAAFNRPVVGLGAEPESLTAPFQLEPAAAGRGEWVNTSTYIFYPEPALQGGQIYTVQLDSSLLGVDGSPLAEVASWSFTTAMPQLVSVQTRLLEDGSPPQFIDLDTPFTLTFNQPMDTSSVEAKFGLLGPDGANVPGKVSWNDDHTVMTFEPSGLLERDTVYSVALDAGVQAAGGSLIESANSVAFTTYPSLAVNGSNLGEGGIKGAYDMITLFLSAPLPEGDYQKYIQMEPSVSNLSSWFSSYDQTLNLYGEFDPETDYSLTVSSDLSDRWGDRLGQVFTLTFRTAPLPPNLFVSWYSFVFFLTPQDNSFTVQATNLPLLPTSLGSLTLEDFFSVASGENSYDRRMAYRSSDERTWSQSLDLVPNKSQPVDVYLNPERQGLEPGLYYLRFSPQVGEYYNTPNLLVVANVQVAMKLSATEAFVWAVDLRDNQPIPNAPVVIYDEAGAALAFGETDAEGVFQGSVPPPKDPYLIYYAVVGKPGEELFGMALSNWNQAIASWDFGIPSDPRGPRLEAYLYTDRPIYRPGHTVYFRAVLRQAYNGRYELPESTNLPLTLYDPVGAELFTIELPVSAFGTAHGQITLPADIQPGDYRLASKGNESDIDVHFKIAAYRKPEIELGVGFDTSQVRQGETVQAVISARYYFDAPAGNIPLRWVLYEARSSFEMPDYQVGVVDNSWLNAYNFPFFADPLGVQIQDGQASTNSQGIFELELQLPESEQRKRFTLEVTLQDESGFPVSARASLEANPADIYIGIRPDTWVGRAGEASGFDVQVADWEKEPAGEQALRAEFMKVVWVRQDPQPGGMGDMPKYVPQYTLVGSTDFRTSQAGLARLAFTPPEPGTYQLDISGAGARTELLLWVSGPGQPVWPDLPNQRIRLSGDRQFYQPGDTAQVFVPNPFSTETLALLTVERGIVMRHEILKIQAGGQNLSIPLSSEDAPNVIVSVLLLGRDSQEHPDFRQGYLNLPVSPAELILQVEVVSQPERAGPGDEVNFSIRITDHTGAPVQGEFSLSVVDKAVLALADPNVPDIVSAFYDEQPLGVRTGLSLAAYVRRLTISPLGGGGGDGSFLPQVVREKFPDTAFWRASITTDQDGRAQVSMNLPDSLTSWQVLVRGVTQDTRVGQAEIQIITTKELIVRPVIPRFLVVDDQVQLAAVVQNNTQAELQGEVSLQASGISLDNASAATQQISIPALGRTRLEWWATVQEAESVDLLFSAEVRDAAGNVYQDSIRPASGKLPVLRYSAPQTFSTSGSLGAEYQGAGGELLEIVSLPRTYELRGGSLKLELSSSLAGAVMDALDVLEHYPYECTEQVLSRFLPNLQMYRALQQFGVEAPELKARLDRSLQTGLDRLLTTQNPDGGWSWWSGAQSDPFVSAYVLFGLAQARQSGASLDELVIQRAVDYLYATLVTPQMTSAGWQLDRLAFIHFALAQAGSGDQAGIKALFESRAALGPWSKALLAVAMESISPGDPDARTLISDLEATASRTATGAHWEESEQGWQNMSTPISTTAMVVYALAQRAPGSPLLTDAVRYLMAHRQADGIWGSTYGTAWTILALSEVIKGTGEPAGDFGFDASINGVPLLSRDAGDNYTPVAAEIPISSLFSSQPNALRIFRQAGPGSLYYSAALKVNRPVEEVAPLQRGISLSRTYYRFGESCARGECLPLESITLGEKVRVRLNITLQEAAYYLIIEDYLPAGSEILDTSLITSQLGEQFFEQPEDEELFDPSDPYGDGWGWWLFSQPLNYDDHIAWSADYLPAGSYVLEYTLVPLQAGEYRVLPARAWQFYFPEVQGNSAGGVFTINP